MTYKVIFCLVDVSTNFFVVRDNTVTRRHSYKIMIEHWDNNAQKQFLPLHAIAMERYCHRMASVCLSVRPSVCDVGER